jgi:hypothetical protein
MKTKRRPAVLLVFGIVDTALGIFLVVFGHPDPGIVLLIIGLLLTAATFIPRPRQPKNGARLSRYAYQYAMVGAGFLTLAVALFGSAISSASQGNGVADWAFAAIGGVFAIVIAIGSAFSIFAARRIAAGHAGAAEVRWLPGWRLFVQEPNQDEQRGPAGDKSRP